MAHSVRTNNRRKWLWGIPLILLLIYFLGPAPDAPQLPSKLPEVTTDLAHLSETVDERESRVAGLKPDNESRILWYDEENVRTPYVFLYLHGWSASYKEGDPVHHEIAQRYGANLYLPRLYGHGIDLGDENFADITATNLMESASQALAEAHLLGDSVIVMGTSTGGTLGIYLAGIDPKISAMVLYSPNIQIYDPSARILNDPWGLQIAKIVTGSAFHGWEEEGPRKQYWTTHYQLRGLSELETLVETTMVPAVFEKVQQPTFVGYYYKNDSLQDNTVSVEAIQQMFPHLGSSTKKLVDFPEVGHHVMASSLTSQDLESVKNATINFLEESVGLRPMVEADSVAEVPN